MTSLKKIDRGRQATKKKAAPLSGPETDSNIAKLTHLMKLLEDSSLFELSFEDGDFAVQLSKGATGVAASAAPIYGQSVPAMAETPEIEAQSPDIFIVESPFVGTFYRSPSPEAPSFAEAGKRVSRGQTLCIVEAMKLMNEIESEVEGEILEVLVENASPVQYGTPLLKIRTSPSSE